MAPSSTIRTRLASAKVEDQPDRSLSTENAVRIGLRRRQRLALQQGGPEHVFIVESGCLTLDTVLPGNRRQVALVLYAGDMIAKSAAPPVPQVGLTAMLPSMVARLRIDDTCGTDLTGLGAATARLAARSSLHTIAIGRLTGEERIATLFLEMALYLGKPTPGGWSFEIPLSRSDMADYMALNPDTLSRLVSRLRASGLITMPTRSRATVKDLSALEELTPLAQSLRMLRDGVATYPAGNRNTPMP
ncbi:MAG: Crp/Fnr family transcriptional regulator [Hyphomicrobiaceae bacterium]